MNFQKLLAAAAIGSTVAFSSITMAASTTTTNEPKQSVGEYTSDAVLTTKVKAAIVAEKDLSALDVAVETTEGVVQLTGTVATAAQADLAARVTRDVNGVKQVKNLIKVDATKAK
ncbi:BON domain-containing protein [Alcaligenaceae bacterium A4P071]|nr:BON domain-containing protein [Alcaligenaceae bacterium A4P071]